MSTLYMGGDKDSIAKYVLFSGDPWRVEVIKNYLEDVQKVAFKREFNTYTGTYKGVRVTVSSTGIGAPSAAIAMEEMYSCGMEVAIRMGTVMALKDELLGHYVIPIASMREEGTSRSYVDLTYPAVADMELVSIMNRVVKEMGKKYSNGLSCTVDGFYAHMHESEFSKKYGSKIQEKFTALKKIGVDGMDMESSCILTLGRLMGIKTCSLTLATVLENLKQSIQGKEREEAETMLCKIALEGIYLYHKEHDSNKG